MKNLEKQSVLKKQFREEDIQRVRNLVTGKYGSKINQSVGYKKPDIIRKEGEVWEEDGRTWTIKKGIKQNITKLDKAKKAYITPLFCPNCRQGTSIKN
jgi:ribosomal protein L33